MVGYSPEIRFSPVECRIKMNNFEKIKGLTLEEMASLNVKSFTYNSGYNVATDYYTTDGSIYETREQAESYERSWLQREIDSMVFGE